MVECVIGVNGLGRAYVSFNDETDNEQLLQVCLSIPSFFPDNNSTNKLFVKFEFHVIWAIWWLMLEDKNSGTTSRVFMYEINIFVLNTVALQNIQLVFKLESFDDDVNLSAKITFTLFQQVVLLCYNLNNI